MIASVIICSRNRIDTLLETLDSLVAMRVPAGVTWEIVVVDNASQDGTRRRVAEWAANAPVPVQALEEQRPGKSYALNLALDEARGQFLLFTDDDALVDPDWLANILAAFASSGADCVGGKVLPLWLDVRPPWLGDRLLNVLAMLDLGSEPRELTGDAMLYGVNYAFRSVTFSSIGPYDTKLCGRGCGNEDFDMINRLRAAGGRVWYDPRVLVHHKVFPERLTRAYFRRWHKLVGQDRAETLLPKRRRVFGLEVYLVKDLSVAIWRLLVAGLRFDLDEGFYQELRCRLFLAYVGRRLRQVARGGMPLEQQSVGAPRAVVGTLRRPDFVPVHGQTADTPVDVTRPFNG